MSLPCGVGPPVTSENANLRCGQGILTASPLGPSMVISQELERWRLLTAEGTPCKRGTNRKETTAGQLHEEQSRCNLLHEVILLPCYVLSKIISAVNTD